MKIRVLPLISITKSFYSGISDYGYQWLFLNNQQNDPGKYTSIPWLKRHYSDIPSLLCEKLRGYDQFIFETNRSTIDLHLPIIQQVKQKLPNLKISGYYGDCSVGWGQDFTDRLCRLGKIIDKLLVSDSIIVEAAKQHSISSIQYTTPPGLIDYFYPTNILETYDACFVGQSYNKKSANYNQERIKWLDYLHYHGMDIKIAVGGSGDWGKFPNYIQTEMGDHSDQKFIQCNQIFNQSKIILCYDVWDIPMHMSIRTANALLTGKMILTKYKKGFENIFTNHENIVWFNDHQECVELLKRYTNDDQERNRISKNGQRLALDIGMTTIGMIKRLLVI